MTDQSVAQPAHPTIPVSTTPVEEIAAKAEAELERLRRARPHLASRVDRAESIIVRQLGNLNAGRPVVVAIHPDGGYSYLVASDSRLSLRYEVNPHDWSCSCPDYRRREAACKHAIACWVLERVYRSPEPKTVEPESATVDSDSLRNAVPLAVVTAGLDRMSA